MFLLVHCVLWLYFLSHVHTNNHQHHHHHHRHHHHHHRRRRRRHHHHHHHQQQQQQFIGLIEILTRLLQLCFDKDFLIPREKEPPGLWELTFKPWDKLFTLSPVLLFLVPFWLFCISLVFYSLKYCFNASVNYVIR